MFLCQTVVSLQTSDVIFLSYNQDKVDIISSFQVFLVISYI
jgi:hypothetical protein